MKTSKAYDLPLRIFHWSFATLFVLSFSIAKVIDDDSTLFAYHMLSGLLMVSLVLFRIIWGLLGSKTSRLSSLKLSPSELVEYFDSILLSRSKRYLGHNPASSYAAILMFALTFGIASSGIMMILGVNKHFFEEVHELLTLGLLIVAIIHIAGVILHQVTHKDRITISMISGKKNKIEGEKEIESNFLGIGIVLAALIIFEGVILLKSYNPNTGQINIFGKQVNLRENEKKELHKSHNNFDDEDNYDDND